MANYILIEEPVSLFNPSLLVHTLKKHYSFMAGINNPFNKIDDHPEFYNLTSYGRMFINGVSINL